MLKSELAAFSMLNIKFEILLAELFGNELVDSVLVDVLLFDCAPVLLGLIKFCISVCSKVSFLIVHTLIILS